MKYQLKCKINNETVNLIIKADNEDQTLDKVFGQYKNVVEVISVNDNPMTISHSLARFKVHKDNFELHKSFNKNEIQHTKKTPSRRKHMVVMAYC